MDSAKILGNRIQKIRTAKKITQEELARRTDKSPHFISDVERGKKKPSVFTLVELIQGLETTPNEILSDFVTLEDELLSDVVSIFSEMTEAERKFLLKIMMDYKDFSGR